MAEGVAAFANGRKGLSGGTLGALRRRFLCVAPAVALNVHLENRCVMDETIDGGEGHRRIDEDFAPLREWRVGGNRDASVFVAFGNEFEAHRGLGLIPTHVAEIVQDQKVEPIEFRNFLCESKIATRRLQTLHKIAASREQDAATGIDKA